MRLVAENIDVARGGQIFFSGINIELVPGDALIVTGPNGVGKSTLLRVLAGLLPTPSGRIEFQGGDYEAVSEACHYLGHRNGMKRELSVEENLIFWQRFMRSESNQTRSAALSIDEAAEAVGLSGLGHLPFGYLSAGQQRRMAMARLLLNYRPVWILDEPTSALDAKSHDMFAGLVARHIEEGGMAILATHQPLGLKSPRQLALEPRADAAFLEYDPFAMEPDI